MLEWRCWNAGVESSVRVYRHARVWVDIVVDALELGIDVALGGGAGVETGLAVEACQSGD
jgi:hypothetical protein